MKRPLYVLSPAGPKSEADELRRLFAEPGRTVRVGAVAGHTAGQTIHGDVVVIGAGAPTIEQDATGDVTRYGDLASVRRSAKPKSDPDHPPLEPPAVKADEYGEPEPEPDPLDALDRMALIKMGAERWPRQRSWATLSDEALRAAIRELEAGD